MSQEVPKTAHGQIQGARNYQEDRLGVLESADHEGAPPYALLTLADGMGGHAAGDVAATLVVDFFIRGFEQAEGPATDRLAFGLEQAHRAVKKKIAHDPALRDMGATLVGALYRNKKIEWISVGDSILFVFQGGQLQRLNADHSMVPVLEAMVDDGQLTREEAETDGRRNMLRSVVSGENIEMRDLSSQPFLLQDDAIIVLASDGIETLANDEIRDILDEMSNEPSHAIVAELLSAVESREEPKQDNTSIIVSRVSDPLDVYEEDTQTKDIEASLDADFFERDTLGRSKKDGSLIVDDGTGPDDMVGDLDVEETLEDQDLLKDESYGSDEVDAFETLDTDATLDGENSVPGSDGQSPDDSTEDKDTVFPAETGADTQSADMLASTVDSENTKAMHGNLLDSAEGSEVTWDSSVASTVQASTTSSSNEPTPVSGDLEREPATIAIPKRVPSDLVQKQQEPAGNRWRMIGLSIAVVLALVFVISQFVVDDEELLDHEMPECESEDGALVGGDCTPDADGASGGSGGDQSNGKESGTQDQNEAANSGDKKKRPDDDADEGSDGYADEPSSSQTDQANDTNVILGGEDQRTDGDALAGKNAIDLERRNGSEDQNEDDALPIEPSGQAEPDTGSQISGNAPLPALKPQRPSVEEMKERAKKFCKDRDQVPVINKKTKMPERDPETNDFKCRVKELISAAPVT